MILCKSESGADPGIFDWGGPNFGSEGTVGLFWGKLILPHTPHTLSHQSRLHVTIPWPLTVVLLLLVKDAPLEHPPLVFGYKDCTDFVNINVKVMM